MLKFKHLRIHVLLLHVAGAGLRANGRRKYGLLHGQVITVSQDAVIRDRPQDRGDRALGTPNETSEPKGQELNYSARISLDRGQMQIDDRMVNLSPGMAVTVEIKTGSRTILSYLLSPMLRYRQETLRER